MGWGPMTGRGAGYCAGFGMPGYMNPIPGRGYWGWGGGRGGRGRGWRRGSFATGLPGRAPFGAGYPFSYYDPYASGPAWPGGQMDALRAEAEYLEETLRGVRKRLEELETERGEGKK